MPGSRPRLSGGLLRVHDGDSNRIQILRTLGTNWTTARISSFTLRSTNFRTFADALTEYYGSDELARTLATAHQLISHWLLLRLFQNTAE
jgi:hypothetical protein